MKRKSMLAVVLSCVMLGLAGCGAEEASVSETTGDAPKTEQTETETKATETEADTTSEAAASEQTTTEAAASEENTTDPANSEETTADAPAATTELATYESPYGYKTCYNDALFEVINSEGSDSFQLIEEDLETDVPTYMAVQVYEETAEILAEGLALQSGLDGVEVIETTMGAESYPSYSVSYSQEEPRGTLYQTFHVLDVNGTVYLVEVGCGDQVGPEVQNAIEEMLAFFEVTK